MILVDSHCHLDYNSLSDNLEAVLKRASTQGVGAALTIGTTLAGFERVRTIAEQNETVFCSVGVHPHEAVGAADVTPERLVELTRHPKVIGIGETGLDFHYDYSPRPVQKTVFEVHIAAARESGLPLIIHSREADADMAAMLRQAVADGAVTGVLHCFSSGRALAESALELGFYVSISGIVTFKAADDLRAIVRDLPLDRILVETDAPYLAPVPHRGRPNEPALIVHTAQKVAEIKGIDLETLAVATTDNFFRLFTKAVRPPAAA
jgi:TatD DNase family protein